MGGIKDLVWSRRELGKIAAVISPLATPGKRGAERAPLAALFNPYSPGTPVTPSAGPADPGATGQWAVSQAPAGADGSYGVVQVPAPTGVPGTDLANIQAAIEALPEAGGLVQLQAGTYVVPAPSQESLGCVTMTRNNSALAGYGIGVTTIKLAPGSRPVTGIIRTHGEMVNRRITFRDLTVDGNAAGQRGKPRVVGFFCGVTPHRAMTDSDISCIQVEIMNCTGYGFDPHTRTTRLLMLGCVAHHNGLDGAYDGITLDGNYEAEVIGCTSYANGRHGFNLVTASNSCRLIGCDAYDNSVHGYMLQEGSKDCVLSGCSARDNAGDGIRIDGTGKPGQLDPTPGYNNAVKDCTVLRSGQHGIHLSGATGQHISGNTVRDSSQGAGGQYSHVMLDVAGAVPSTGNTITGNDLGMTPGVSRLPQHGIYEVAGADYNMAVANQLSGPAAGPLLRLQGAHSLGYAAHNGTFGGHPHTFSYAFDNPAFHGFTEWNFPPLLCGSSVQPPVTGIIYLLSMYIQDTGPLSAVHLFMTHAGYGLTAGQNLVGCYRVEAGRATLLASVDQTAAWSDARLNGHAVAAKLSSPLPVTAGAVILFSVLSNGTQPPAFSCAPAPTGLAANAGLGKEMPYRVSICRGTERTSLPATIELVTGTTAAGSLPFWIAAS